MQSGVSSTLPTATGAFQTPVDLTEYTIVPANDEQQMQFLHAAMVPWGRGHSVEVDSWAIILPRRG